jgi:hypothetical protein
MRIVAATIGAYATAIATSFALVTIFHAFFNYMLSDAVYFSVMLSYFFFFFTVIASFALKSLKRLYASLTCINVGCLLMHFIGFN